MTPPLDALIGMVSPSRLECAQRCLAQFCFRYVERIPERWRSGLGFGRAVDATGTEVYRDKLRTGDTLSERQVQEVFAAEWDFTADAIDDWEPGDSKGALLDVGTRAVAAWRDKVAQHVQPEAVQERLTATVADPAGNRFDVLGILDLRAVVAGVQVVCDLKTAERQYHPNTFLRRMQPAAYTMLAQRPVFEFHVVTKTKVPAVQVLRWRVPDDERASFVRRAGMIRRQIEHAYATGDWLPNRTSFLCTRRHCEFWQHCERRHGGRVPA